MHGACFDPGPRRGRGGALLGKPRRLLGGDVEIQPGCRCLKTPIPGAVVGFGGSHVIPLCPVPLPAHFYLPLGVPVTGFSAPAPQQTWWKPVSCRQHQPWSFLGRARGRQWLWGVGMALPPLPGHPAPHPTPLPGAGKGGHSGRGDSHPSDHPEPCSPRHGHGVPQPCPS